MKNLKQANLKTITQRAQMWAQDVGQLRYMVVTCKAVHKKVILMLKISKKGTNGIVKINQCHKFCCFLFTDNRIQFERKEIVGFVTFDEMIVFKVSTFWLIALYGMVYPGSVETQEHSKHHNYRLRL